MGGLASQMRIRWPALSFFSFGLAALAFHAAAPLQASAQTQPRRIVSINVCTDELLLRLAPASRIASVTWLSRDREGSNVADLAARMPINYGLAEEVIPLAPDLVVTGIATIRAAVALLNRAGVPVVEFGIANNFTDFRAQARKMAALLGDIGRGEQLIRDIDHRLDAIGLEPGAVNTIDRPTALVFNPNGFTDGSGTLVDEIMTRAGLDNLASHPDFANYDRVPLEVLAERAPDVLVVGESRDGPPALATELLKHPVIARLQPHTHIVVLPSRLWTCPGPASVDAIDILKAVADKVRAERTAR